VQIWSGRSIFRTLEITCLAVVVFDHAGTATRDAAVYRHLREGLPALGFAVLIYDRRGSGQSSGSLQGVDYETLADDAVAGQHALAELSRIDPAKIGFWGLNQGWLARRAGGKAQPGLRLCDFRLRAARHRR
jgi:predicted alpha/beta hydrolase